MSGTAVKKTAIVYCLLLLLLANNLLCIGIYRFEAKASQIVEKVGYTKIETTKVTYFVNQVLMDNYGQEIFSKLFNLVDERFEKIMNITSWSSEKFYGHRLEVTIDSKVGEGADGNGGFGSAHIQINRDFLSNETAQRYIVNLFLHEMTHGITPTSILSRIWLTEGYARLLSDRVQILFKDKTQTEIDESYNTFWKQYVDNDYLDFSFNLNKTIQDGYGGYVTAWMLNNITQTYGWFAHEDFFKSIPDEYLFYLPDFSLSITESTSYNYYLDSLIVSYYSLAVGKSLYSDFKSWGVKILPNPITIISLNGTRIQNQTFTSKVMITLFAFGDNAINKIEYSFDQKIWNTYTQPFSISDDTFLCFRSIDSMGNIGPSSSITLNFGSSNSASSEPPPAPLVIISSVGIALAVIGLVIYSKKHNHQVRQRNCEN
jgi:hypothetical protein